MSTKKKQHTTISTGKTKRASPITDPDCIYAWRCIPVSLAMVGQITADLLEWPAKNPDAKTITEFYLAKGLTQQTYNRLVNKHEALKEAHEITMRRLGERLWGKAVDNKANWKPVQFMLHNYAPEFKESSEYHSSLKQSEVIKDSNRIIVVEMPPIPNIKEVEYCSTRKNKD